MNNNIFETVMVITFSALAFFFLVYGLVSISDDNPFMMIINFGVTYIFGNAVFNIVKKWHK